VRRTLLAILAHPDDETLGLGGTLARYAAEGASTHVLSATRGQRGRFFSADHPHPGVDEVGRVREDELRRAAEALGVSELTVLECMDGELDQADVGDLVNQIAGHVRRIQPQVVVTFDPYGAYGHPDHIAISQLAVAAVIAAADPSAGGAAEAEAPHRVSKLYYMAWGEAAWDAYQSAFKTLVSRVDGQERRARPWPDWSISARLDTRAWIDHVWRAVQCHETQIAMYETLGQLPRSEREAIWGWQTFYRVFSLVNGGREIENDLFAGIG
jgi:LmbE family N-acetylglucosaminyl deacetylase